MLIRPQVRPLIIQFKTLITSDACKKISNPLFNIRRGWWERPHCACWRKTDTMLEKKDVCINGVGSHRSKIWNIKIILFVTFTDRILIGRLRTSGLARNMYISRILRRRTLSLEVCVVISFPRTYKHAEPFIVWYLFREKVKHAIKAQPVTGITW